MEEELKIINFIEKNKKIIDKDFLTTMISEFELKSMLELNEKEVEGLKLIDKTIPYINNIFNNPNRIIENTGDVVKIELAKKITPESIKHLGSHTNLIQSVDKEKDEIKPSKILNIEKIENFLTYENRLIYTLIQNILFFIRKAKENIEKIEILDVNPDKDLKFHATAKDKGEDINITLQISTQMDRETLTKKINQQKKLIEEIEKKTMSIMNMEIYLILDNAHIKEVTPPIKKTNLILKNVNFIYAMKLWEFLQEYIIEYDEYSNDKMHTENQNTNKALHHILNEAALIDYTILKKYKQIETEEKETEVFGKGAIHKEQIKGLKKQEINKLIMSEIKKGEFKNYMVEQQIKKEFLKYIDEYCEGIKKKTE